MEKGFRKCPKCGNTFAKFYIQEEPSKGKPFFTVVFVCEADGCHHEWVEPIYEYRVIRKIKSDRYRQYYDHLQCLAVEEAKQERIIYEKEKRMKTQRQEKDEQKGKEEQKERKKLMQKGLSPWEIDKKIKLRIRKIA